MELTTKEEDTMLEEARERDAEKREAAADLYRKYEYEVLQWNKQEQ